MNPKLHMPSWDRAQKGAYMDGDTVRMIRDSLDTSYAGARGQLKRLRYFTADDCRAYARKNKDLALAGLAESIDKTQWLTVGEVLAELLAKKHRHGCARCDFQNSIHRIVVAAEFMEERYSGTPKALTPDEQALVSACREWLADDTIRRCLAEAE